MASKIKVDQIQTADGTGTIALQNQLSGMTTASLPALGSAQMPAGSVVQHVNSALSGSGSSSSVTSWFDTGLSITITPKLSSSNLVVFFTQGIGVNKGTDPTARVDWGLYCVSPSVIIANNTFIGTEGLNTAGTTRMQITGSGTYNNTSTAAKTFKVQIRKANGAASECGLLYYQWYTGGKHTMQVFEVAG